MAAAIILLVRTTPTRWSGADLRTDVRALVEAMVIVVIAGYGGDDPTAPDASFGRACEM
jgi:hypothetical protein